MKNLHFSAPSSLQWSDRSGLRSKWTWWTSCRRSAGLLTNLFSLFHNVDEECYSTCLLFPLMVPVSSIFRCECNKMTGYHLDHRRGLGAGQGTSTQRNRVHIQGQSWPFHLCWEMKLNQTDVTKIMYDNNKVVSHAQQNPTTTLGHVTMSCTRWCCDSTRTKIGWWPTRRRGMGVMDGCVTPCASQQGYDMQTKRKDKTQM